MDLDEQAEDPASHADTESVTTEGVEEEPDFPEVKIDELLEDFDEMTLAEAEAD